MIKKALKNKVILIASLLLLVFFSSGFYFVKDIGAWNLIEENAFVRHFVTNWRSFKKITDLPYELYQFKKSEIPTYYLNVSSENISKLNLGLPQDYYFSRGELIDEYKNKVNALFIQNDYEEEVKVRYRGLKINHWNASKKSWFIEFPKSNLFDGNKILDFIIPEDRAYVAESLNVYRANKFDLLTPQVYFANLDINGNVSVYLVNEHWSEEFLEKNARSTNGQIYGASDLSIKTNYNFLTLDSVNNGIWEKRIDRPDLETEDFSGMALLFSLMENSDESIFKKNIGNIFDLDKFYDWMLVILLAASEHHGDSGNMDFYFNPVSGKLELIPRDVYLDSPKDVLDFSYNSFVSRLLVDPEIRKNVEDRVLEYVSDEKNLEDDLLFYDELWRTTKRDFYADNSKFQSSFYVKNKVAEYRNWIIENFYNLRKQLEENNFLNIKIAELELNNIPIEKRGSFSSFDKISESLTEFTQKYPIFIKTGENKVRLPRGEYFFNNDIIIPENIELEIGAGTSIYLGKGVSFVSYSPVLAEGTLNLPIKVKRADKNEPWGSFAVVNAKEKESKFVHTYFSGGGGDIINGIKFTGMLAVYESDVLINNSEFEKASDDDALNIKSSKFLIKYSLFKDNFSDSIDIDFSEGEIISSLFTGDSNEGGDAIDLSFSKVTIEGNKITSCGDKGVSVGERSKPLIKNNNIENCNIGIAVKDSSHAEIVNSIIKNNDIGISLYRKKQIFGGGSALISEVIFESNKKDTEEDNYSEIFYKNE